MIIYQDIMYCVEKKRFGWYRVYQDGILHSKFKYEASAINFVNLKWEQDVENMNKTLKEGGEFSLIL